MPEMNWSVPCGKPIQSVAEKTRRASARTRSRLPIACAIDNSHQLGTPGWIRKTQGIEYIQSS